MGMSITIEAEAPQELFEKAFAEFKRIDQVYSTYKPQSVISHIRSGKLLAQDAPQEVQQVLEECAKWRTQTHGYFDAYYSGVLDPSSYVKGWAIAQVRDILVQANLKRFLIDAGGDMSVAGVWRVGIQHPDKQNAIVAALQLSDGAIATSGLYRRGEHIINPKTASPANILKSVTVVGPNIITADILATTFFAMGEEYQAYAQELLPDTYEIYVIDSQNQANYTAGLKTLLSTQ